MQIYYDKMEYRDVVMANYVININKPEQFQYSQQDFLEYVVAKKLEYKGPVTYYLESANKEVIRIHYILQVRNWHFMKDDKIAFQSYYGFEKMICTRVRMEELKNLASIFKMLEEKIVADGYNAYGPLYYVLPKVPTDEIIYLKMPVIN